MPSASEGVGRPLHQQGSTDQREHDTEARAVDRRGHGCDRTLRGRWLTPDLGRVEWGTDHHPIVLVETRHSSL